MSTLYLVLKYYEGERKLNCRTLTDESIAHLHLLHGNVEERQIPADLNHRLGANKAHPSTQTTVELHHHHFVKDSRDIGLAQHEQRALLDAINGVAHLCRHGERIISEGAVSRERCGLVPVQIPSALLQDRRVAVVNTREVFGLDGVSKHPR